MNPMIEIIKICDRHADRLNWAITALQDHFPLSANSLENLSDVDIAILDQFSTRFGKLQGIPPVVRVNTNREVAC